MYLATVLDSEEMSKMAKINQSMFCSKYDGKTVLTVSTVIKRMLTENKLTKMFSLNDIKSAT